MQHEKYNYKSYDDLCRKLDEIDVHIPFSDDFGVMFEPFVLCGRRVGNKVVFHPMEGCDSEADGSPGELTNRKYKRFALGGPGIIWFEAVALTQDGRANAGQLYLNNDTLGGFKRCVDSIKETCLAENGFEPLIIMQATHSGRYSRSNGTLTPIIACGNPLFEATGSLPDARIITDGELRDLEGVFARGAELAAAAGFDGYDIKACHGYLVHELLSAYDRGGDYGGSFDNRTRFLRNTATAVRSAAPEGFIVTSRLNIYDGFKYPYGFGAGTDNGSGKDNGAQIDLSEPQALIDILREESGMQLLNATMGIPHINPHVSRPYDVGGYVPEEHPLAGVGRLLENIGKVQKKNPSVRIVATGLSYLRAFSPYAAAGMLKSGAASLVGFGRESIAYPDFLRDLKESGGMKREKVCLTCGQCSLLLRAGQPSGCVVRDMDVYKGRNGL